MFDWAPFSGVNLNLGLDDDSSIIEAGGGWVLRDCLLLLVAHGCLSFAGAWFEDRLGCLRWWGEGGERFALGA